MTVMTPLKASASPYIARPDMADSPISHDTKTLPGLPPELILAICDFLPHVDRVCLSLCNHLLRTLFQAYFSSTLLGEKTLKFSICDRLERDPPEYFACEICSILHRYDGSESFGLSGIFYDRTCPLPCVDEHSYDL
jgi:hypothetical protein